MKKSFKKMLSIVLSLMMAFSVVLPAFAVEDEFAKYLGQVDSLTEGVRLVDGVFTNSDSIVLDYASATEISDGFGGAAWRIIFRLNIAESVTDGMIAQAKYYNKVGDEWVELGLIGASEFYNSEDKTIAFAVDVTAEDLAKEALEASFAFDWDYNGLEETVQKVDISIDMSKVELTHSSGCTEYTDAEEIAPTCTNPGYTEISHCSVCGLDILKGEEIPAIGHSFTEKVINDAHLKEKNGDGTSTYFYNCGRADCDAISEEDTYLVSESDYTVSAATVTPHTENLSVITESTSDITVTNENMIVLDFSPKDPSAYRFDDGWWVGFRITADTSLTAEQLKTVKYRTLTDNGYSADKSFWNNQDSKPTADVHYLDCWVLVTPKLIKENTRGYLYIAYEFDWDSNGYGVSTQTIEVKINYTEDTLKLVHTAGHTVVVDEEAVEATCDKGGYTEQSHCSVCGLVLSVKEPVEAYGHDFSEVILDEAHLAEKASCDHYDLYRYSCVRCDVMSPDTFYEDKEGSTLLDHVEIRKLDDIHLISPADCENPAKYYMGCVNCDIVFEDKEFTDGKPLYHSWKDERISRKATMTADGAINFYCVDCKKSDNSPIPIAKIASVKLAAKSYSYTGKAITPAVTILDRNGAELRKGTDYTVTYLNSDVPGTATARITFIGKYEGTYDATYTIQIPVPAKTSFASNNSALKISWDKVANASAYAVYHKISTGWKLLGTTKNTSVTFNNLPSGTKYTFAVKAGITKNGKTYYTSNYVTINATTTSPAPAKVVAAQNTSAIKLTWSAVKNAEGYAVLLKTQNGWKTVALTASTTVTLSGLTSGTNYIYAVRSVDLTASNQKIGGGYIQLTTATKPIAPVVSVTTQSGSATIRWTGVKGANGYEVYYKSTTSGGYVLLGTVGSGTTSFTDSGYRTGSKYAFAVRATKAVQGGYIYSTAGQSIVTMN